ncbi:MAG: hypothetical protein ACK47B_09745 [Armatimonadota bacterium]
MDLEASKQAPPLPDDPINVKFEGTPLREALKQVLDQSGAKLEVSPVVPDLPVRLTLTDLPRDRVVQAILRQASIRMPGVQLVRSEEVWRVQLHADDRIATAAEYRIKYESKGLPLRTALAKVVKDTPIRLKIEPAVGNPPVQIKPVYQTRHQLLEAIVEAGRREQPMLRLIPTETGYSIELQRPPNPNEERPVSS